MVLKSENVWSAAPNNTIIHKVIHVNKQQNYRDGMTEARRAFPAVPGRVKSSEVRMCELKRRAQSCCKYSGVICHKACRYII